MKEWRKNSKITSSSKEISSLSEQNSTQEVDERENRWIVLSQICMAAWQGTAILAAKRRAHSRQYCRGITKLRTFGKTSTRSESHPGKSYKFSETKRDGETTTKTFLTADSSLLQRTLMASRKENHGETKEASKRSRKNSINSYIS